MIPASAYRGKVLVQIESSGDKYCSSSSKNGLLMMIKGMRIVSIFTWSEYANRCVEKLATQINKKVHFTCIVLKIIAFDLII